MHRAVAFFAAVLGFAPYDVPAQAADEAAIVVTAERLVRSPQKIPVSIAVIGAGELEASKTGSIMEMQKLVPGLTVTEESTGRGQAYIRGIGTDIVSGGVEGAVAVYVDGIYQSRTVGETMRFIDVERIEVLKGPQGVLYGRNATGGAINIVSKAPSRKYLADVDIQAGSRDGRVWRGTVSGPLAEEKAYGRLSLLFNRDGGDTRNTLLDVTGNSSDVRGLRGALELTPDDAFSLTIAASHYRDDFSPVLKPLHPEASPLFTVFGAKVIDDPRTVMANQSAAVRLTQTGVDATAKWDFDASHLTSITALRKTDYAGRQADLDGTEVPFINVGSFGVLETTHFFSQEFTLASDAAGPLSWVGLACYTHQKVEQPAFHLAFPVLNLNQNSVATVTTDAWAVGGQAIYAVTERIHVTGGARLSTETKHLEHLRRYDNGVLSGSLSDKKTWAAATPKLAVDYAPDKSRMYYVSAAKGFKSGGFNTTTLQPGFDPEAAINYEAGYKGKWLNGRLRTSIAAFHTQYKDMQVSVVTSADALLMSTIRNAAKAESRGIEANLAWAPTARLDLSAGMQLLRARFLEFVSVDPRFPAAGQQSQAGNPLSRAPDFTASVAAQYAWPAQDGRGRLTLRGEGSYRSKIYFSPFRDDYASAPAVTVWNAMLTYEPAGRRGWHGSAFVKNLTNRTYPASVFDPQSLGYFAFYAPGRTAGIQLGYRY